MSSDAAMFSDAPLSSEGGLSSEGALPAEGAAPVPPVPAAPPVPAVPPATPTGLSPSAGGPAVTLRGGDLPWQSVSAKLFQVRLITLLMALALPIVGSVVLAVAVTAWLWIGTAVLAAVVIVTARVLHRQVSAISWVELPEELVIRKGRLLRSLVSVPYGRLQYVDVQSGPLMRAYGLARLQLHTASPASGGTVAGIPVAQAEALRTRLAARGETQRAGL